MWIGFEPNGWMAHVNLYFSKRDRAIEDQGVQEYLREHKLAPRRILEAENDGEQLEVWQYGECYIRFHLQQVESLRWQGFLSDVLRHSITDSPDLARLAQGIGPEELREMTWSLAATVSANNAAMQDKDDPSKLHIDQAFVTQELEKLVAARRS